MWVFHLSRPYDTRVDCESCRNVEKMAQKCIVGSDRMLQLLTGCNDYTTGCRVRDVFCTISHRSSMTSPKDPNRQAA